MLLSPAGHHGDTAFQLRRIRQRRQQLEAAGGFPASGAGIKLQQERLAANAAAASARNKALQQSLAEAADAQRLTAAGSMDPQLLALTGAYLNLMRAAFPAWAAQAGPSLQEHQLQQSCTVSSWYAGPASHPPCTQHSTPAGAGKQSFRFNIPQPTKSFSQQQHPQQQQQRQHQPMQYALSPQRRAGTAGGQDAAGTQLQGQQAGTAGAAAGTSGQASACTRPQQQQQQHSCASSDPFMTSLQDITSQLALLQQALSSHQQLQQQQQLSRGTEPRAAGPSFSLRSRQPVQPAAAAAAGAPSPSAAQAGAVAAAAAAATAGSVMPASSNGSCDCSPVAATSSAPASAAAAADVTTTPKTQRLIQARLEQQQQRSAQSSDGAASAAAAAAQHSTAAADGSAQVPPEQAGGALRQPSDVEHETVTYTVGCFKVQESPPSRPVSRTPSMPNSHAPTPCPDSPGADDPPAACSEPPQQQGGQQQQQAEGAAADDGEGGSAALESAAVPGDTGARASAAGTPCAGQLDVKSAAAEGASSMLTMAKEAAEQQQQQQPDAAAVCAASQAGQSRAEVLQVDAVAVVSRPSTAAGTSSSTKGSTRPAIKSPPPPPPLPQLRQQQKQKLSTPAVRSGVGGGQQQQGGDAVSEASTAQPAGRSMHHLPQQAEGRKQEQQQQQQVVAVVSPRPSFGTRPEQAAGCIDCSPSRRTSLAAGGAAPAAAGGGGGGGGGGGSSAAAGSLSPTASLHLHQQLVFSPLQLGSVTWKAADSPSVTASPGVTGGAGTAAAAAAAALHTKADITASPGSRGVAAEVLQQQQQQLPGVLQMARALSGEAQQLVFSPLRLSSTSLPAPALSPTSGTAADTKQVQNDASQQEQEEEQGELLQQRSAASSGSGVEGQASAAAVVPGQEGGPSTQQHQQEEEEEVMNITEAAGTAAGPAAALTAGEPVFTPTAPQAASLPLPGLQEPAGPSMPLWEQAVFSPQKSATGTGTAAAAAAAAAGSPSTLVSPMQPGQLATDGLRVPTDRQEVVFSPLRLGAAGGGGSVSRGSFGVGTPSPPGSAVQQQQRQASPQRQQQQPSSGSSSVPVGAAFLGSLSPVRTPAGASGAGSAQRPNSQLVLLSGSAVTQQQQQQQQQQRLGISSLAVGLGPGRSPAGAALHDTPQQDGGSRVLRTHSSSGGSGTATGMAAGPLHSNLGYITGTAATAAAAVDAAATAGGNSLASSIHMGLLLSPATRLSLGGASTVDEAAWSSGRPSLGSNAGDVGEAGRLSVGPPLGPAAAATLAAVAGAASRGAGGVRTTGEGVGGVSGAGSLGAGAAGGLRQQPVVMASWSSMSSNASGNVPRVPRLSLPPTLHVPDAPVPGSGNRSGASSSRNPDAGTAASLGRQQQQGGSGMPAQLPPPSPELLAHLRKSQQQQQQQQQQPEQVSTTSGLAASQLDWSAAAGSSAIGGSRQGIGSCKVSSGGAASDRDRLVSKVLNTGLTEFSFEEEEGEGEDEYDDPHDSKQEYVRQQLQDEGEGSGSEFGGD